MLLSFELIYYGDCKDMIRFYLSIFENCSAEIHTFEEMPLAEALGINGPELDMVWQAVLTIHFGNYAVRLKLSDSLLIARKADVNYKEQAYQPLVCIEHPDEQYVRNLLEKLYCGEYCFEDIQKGILCDKYGIRWIYKKSDRCKIYHCLEFKGNCGEVMSYIGNAYQISATEIVKYANSPYADMDGMTAKDKIYSALMEFQDGNFIYAVKFSDSLESVIYDYNGYGPNDKRWYQIIIVVEESDEKYLEESFERLSQGATLNRPISLNEDGRLYGSMIDRYGFVWELLSR